MDDPLDRPGAATVLQVSKGTLYLVGTPIGNLGDLPPRAAAVLEAADFIAAEDTRRTLQLLNHLGIRKRLESYREENRAKCDPQYLAMLRQGKSIALVSDAGMPCISDPGSQLVAACAAAGIPVVVIPGPCAAVVGLAGSGLATDRFAFEGFLPVSGKNRRDRLGQVAAERRTCILYEAPHRLARTLADLTETGLADRRLTLARELTKLHEEYRRTTVGEALAYVCIEKPRGEYVLILEGQDACLARRAESGAADENESAERAKAMEEARNTLAGLLAAGCSRKDAARQVAARTGLKKNTLYQMALDLGRSDGSKPGSLL